MVRNRIRSLRLERGLTQAELASKSGVPQPTISRLDANENAKVALGIAVKLASALGTIPEALIQIT